MMHKLYTRQMVLGATAGLLAGLVQVGLSAVLRGPFTWPGLWGTDGVVYGVAVGLFLGLGYAGLFKPVPGGYVESLMGGVVLGLVGWLLLPLNLTPILAGEGPRWTVEAVALTSPALFRFLLGGAMVGLGYHVLTDGVTGWLGEPEGEAARGETQPASPRHRIVIVGGGFAGVTAAQHLEQLFAGDEQVSLTLISKTNYLLFTPMLSEVTASGVEAQHISTPLRTFFHRTRVIHGEVEAVDLEAGVVRLVPNGRSTRSTVPFDHLVLAVGSVPNFFGMHRVAAHAFTFKSLEDAIRVRNHVIEMLEQADAEPDPERRKALLTFVVAGGGFAGTELIGGLNDFVRGALWYYPNIPPEDVSLILVHSGERILPELSPELAGYAYERLQARGITFRLRTRVVDASPGEVILDTGEAIATETLVWTAGNTPHPLIRRLGVEVDSRGCVRTDPTLAVPGHPNVWAIGDCAVIPDPDTGSPAPPTAQHALREAITLAHNIHAVIRGKEPRPFRYRALGTFAVLGYQTACAEIRGLKFSGLLAWWLWRTVYLLKLPTLEKKIRVALDWTVDLFFPRDIVQTEQVSLPRRERPAPQPTVWPSMVMEREE